MDRFIETIHKDALWPPHAIGAYVPVHTSNMCATTSLYDFIVVRHDINIYIYMLNENL